MQKKLIILIVCSLLWGFVFAVTAQQRQNRVVMEEQKPEVKITFTENRIIIENLPKDDVLEIFNVMGVKVYTQRVKAGTNEYNVNLSKGFYIIRVGTTTKKIAVK